MSTTSTFVPFIGKGERQEDGSVLVRGIATDSTLDIDQQVCDPDWLEKAMPDWFKWGNIREQHSSIAAGVATEYDNVEGKHVIAARIVDPNSAKKVESGVLKGFSIGIMNPRVVNDKAAPGGRIIDGQIVEVSIVDRPANPACRLALAKSVSLMEPGTDIAPADMEGDMVKMEVLTEDEETDLAKTPESDNDALNALRKHIAPGTVLTEEVLEKAFKKSLKKALKKAVKAEAAKTAETVEVPTEAPVETPVEAPTDSTAETVAKMAKRLKRIEKTLRSLTKASKPVADLEMQVTALAEQITEVSKSAVPGPARVRQQVVAPANDNAARAAALRKKAAETSERELAEGYRRLAATLEADATL
jgi:hypothetical protein